MANRVVETAFTDYSARGSGILPSVAVLGGGGEFTGPHFCSIWVPRPCLRGHVWRPEPSYASHKHGHARTHSKYERVAMAPCTPAPTMVTPHPRTPNHHRPPERGTPSSYSCRQFDTRMVVPPGDFLAPAPQSTTRLRCSPQVAPVCCIGAEHITNNSHVRKRHNSPPYRRLWASFRSTQYIVLLRLTVRNPWFTIKVALVEG